MLCCKAKKRGVAAKGNSRGSFALETDTMPMAAVTPAVTKLAVAEKHIEILLISYVWADSHLYRGRCARPWALSDGRPLPDGRSEIPNRSLMEVNAWQPPSANYNVMAEMHAMPDKWLLVSIAPADVDLEVGVIDKSGTVFPVRKSGNDWVDASTKKRIDIVPTHWR